MTEQYAYGVNNKKRVDSLNSQPSFHIQYSIQAPFYTFQIPGSSSKMPLKLFTLAKVALLRIPAK